VTSTVDLALLIVTCLELGQACVEAERIADGLPVGNDFDAAKAALMEIVMREARNEEASR
jgi:recombinational DNA repair protein RecR